MAPDGPSAPTEADLRRAVSTTYYALFHAVLTATADEFIGTEERGRPLYELVYRSVDHRQFRDICNEIGKRTPSLRLARFWPATGFSEPLKTVATIVSELQDARHDADYSSMSTYTMTDVAVTIEGGRRAINLFASLDAAERRIFVTLLAFKARSP